MSNYKTSISFKQKDFKLYESLKTKDNISRYICKLIEADLLNEANSSNLEDKVDKILYRLLQNKKIIEDFTFNTDNIVEKLSVEDIDLINQLF